jgi:impB/mucB/samB family protein
LSWWHTGRKFAVPLYATRDIYIKALRLLNLSEYKKRVRNLAVSVYDLIPSTDEQLELFASPAHAVAEAPGRWRLLRHLLGAALGRVAMQAKLVRAGKAALS